MAQVDLKWSQLLDEERHELKSMWAINLAMWGEHLLATGELEPSRKDIQAVSRVLHRPEFYFWKNRPRTLARAIPEQNYHGEWTQLWGRSRHLETQLGSSARNPKYKINDKKCSTKKTHLRSTARFRDPEHCIAHVFFMQENFKDAIKYPAHFCNDKSRYLLFVLFSSSQSEHHDTQKLK